MKDSSKKNDDARNRRIKITIIIIIIIILLLLITSCTSNFLGTIGNLFRNEEHYIIDKDTNDKPEIINQNLKFDTDKIEVSEGDIAPKISYSYKGIKPGEFTCSTKDAKIATCYVEDGYVVINPKSAGKVTIYLQTESNGKIYKASADVTVLETKKYIALSSSKGTINLANGNKQIITYQLVGLSGDVKVTSSNEKVATATIQDETIKITAKKAGTTTITVSVKYNGKEYTNTYTLKVTGKPSKNPGSSSSSKPNKTPKPSATSKPGGSGNVNGSTGSQIGGDTTLNPRPTQDPSNPSETTKPTSSTRPTPSETTKPTNTPTPTPSETTKPTDTPTPTPSETTKPTDTPTPTPSETTKPTDTPTPTPSETTKPTDTPTPTPSETAKPTDPPTPTPTPSAEAFLLDLSFEDDSNIYKLDQTFKKDKYNGYTMSVGYDSNLQFISTISENATVSYELEVNGTSKPVSPSNIELQPGLNTLKVTVTAENGTAEHTYTFQIYKPKRGIQIDTKEEGTYNIKIEEMLGITYRVTETEYNFEKNQEITKNLSVPDYEPSEVIATLKDKSGNDYSSILKVVEGAIQFDTTNFDVKSLLEKEFTLEATYLDSDSSVPVKFIKDKYSIPASYQDGVYETPFGDGRKDLTFDVSEFFRTENTILSEPIKNGIRIKQEGNDQVYIDVTTDNPDVLKLLLADSKPTASIVVRAEALKTGLANVKVNAYAYSDTPVSSFEIKLQFTEFYEVVLDANGGFYTPSEVTKTIPVESNDTINLKDPEYKAYKVGSDDNKICIYYKLIGYSTNPNAAEDEVEYRIDSEKDVVLTGFNKNLKLYAIYVVGGPEDKPVYEKTYTLSNVDMFKNDQYYQKYKTVKNMIYPGVEGVYDFYFTNQTEYNLLITSMDLTEEKTVCSQGQCLNMGYRVSTVKKGLENPLTIRYPEDQSSSYKILHKDVAVKGANKNIGIGVEVNRGEEVLIKIEWKWVDNDTMIGGNSIDALIGNEAQINNEYRLHAAIHFEETDNSYCTSE